MKVTCFLKEVCSHQSIVVSTQVHRLWISFLTGLVLVLPLHWCPQNSQTTHLLVRFRPRTQSEILKNTDQVRLKSFGGETYFPAPPAVIGQFTVQKGSQHGFSRPLIFRTLPGDALTGNGMKSKNIRESHQLHTTS